MENEEWLKKISNLCSRQEKSPSDVLALLKKWGAGPDTSQNILKKLEESDFVSERRYAEAFVRDKIRLEHWGRVKIRMALTAKGISASLADEVLEKADPEEYATMIRDELVKKSKGLGGKSWERWQKLARFGFSRGYEMDIMHDMLDEICKGKE